MKEQMKIRVLYFAGLRESAQTGEEFILLDHDASVGTALDQLCKAHPKLASKRRIIRVAVDEEMATASMPLTDGATLALMTPFAGGSDAPYARLTRDPIDMEAVFNAVLGPGQGGIVTFVGLVRDHNDGKHVTRLEYDAYPSMVAKSLTSIVDRCENVGEGVRVAVVHRYGALEIGDVAVAIAASAPHRDEAFKAARLCIELIKEETPIWKKEFSPNGEEWITPHP